MEQPPPLPPPLPVFAPPPPLPASPAMPLEDSVGMRLLLPVGRSGWAIAAGYLGLFSLLVVPAPLALVASVIAFCDIQKSKKTGKRKHGTGRAIFGLLAGLAGTAVLIMLLLYGPPKVR